MNPIRPTDVSLGHCDSFEEVCKLINDLYKVAREHRAAIEELQPEKPKKVEPKKKK